MISIAAQEIPNTANVERINYVLFVPHLLLRPKAVHYNLSVFLKIVLLIESYLESPYWFNRLSNDLLYKNMDESGLCIVLLTEHS